MESVILATPILLLGYGLALSLDLLTLRLKRAGFLIPMLATLLAVVSTAGAALHGAGYGEMAAALLVFLCLNITVYGGEDG